MKKGRLFHSVTLILLFFPHYVVLDENSVYEYDPSVFRQQVEDLDGNFIMFYAPWCRYCTEFMPTWKALAELVNTKDSKFAIAQLDCTLYANLCNEIDITGFPTLLYFYKHSFLPIEYTGTRDMPALTLFLSEVFKKYEEKKDKNGENDVRIYSGMAYLTDQNIEKFVVKGQHFIMFYAPWCKESQRLAPIWAELAVQYATNKYIQIGKVNCMENEMTCKSFEIKQYPYLLWIVNGRVMGAANENTLTGLQEYIEKMALEENHDPEKFLRSKKALPVARITEETFDTFLEKELVFIHFIAPWCAHCMQVNPLWIKLGETFMDEERVIIADVDCVRSKPICDSEKAGGPDSVAPSEAPSSGSEDSDCEQGSDVEADLALTEEWAKELLIGSGVVDPQEIRVESRNGIAGALSRILAVTVRYEVEGERCSLPLIVKLPPKDPFGRLFVAEAQFDTREILFYTELAPALNKLAEEALGPGNGLSIPRCVKAKLPDEIGGDSELVLEDVTACGYEPVDFAEGLTVDRAKSALIAAARLHALSLALREREGPLDQRFDFLFPCERAAAGYLRLVRRGLPQLEAFLRGRPDCVAEAAAVSQLSSRAPAILGTLLKPAEPAPLAHADFWSGNLLFRERETVSECIALDWQMVSLGRPMDDVALLILSSLSPEMRRQYGEILIDEYGERLQFECARFGAAKIGTEARRNLTGDWPRAALRALLLCAGSVDVALGEPRAERRLLEAVRDLYAQGVLDLKADMDA